MSHSPIFYLKICVIFTQIQQKRPSQTPMPNRFRDTYVRTSRKSISTEALARSHSQIFIFKKIISNSTKTTLADTCGSLFQTMHAATSRKYDTNESQTRSFQRLNNKIFKYHFPVFILKKLRSFHSNFVKTLLSDTCNSSFQRHVWTNFQKICFYWAQDEIFSVLQQ